jgi:hypothetical protein
MRSSRLAVLVLVAAVVLSGLTTMPADARPATPDWLTCPSAQALRAARGVVLLVPGTGLRPDESFSWGHQQALAADGFATCTVALPDDGLGSFTRAAVRVRKAIRATADLAGRLISVVGHSQGGALPVWDAGRCAALAWQLRVGAHTVAALQHAPLPTGAAAPDVTSLAGRHDESEHGLILGDPVGYALARCTHASGSRRT